MKYIPFTTVRLIAVALIGTAFTQASFSQTLSKEAELEKKEKQLEKKEADLERQRLELEAAKKQLRMEETEQRVTMRLEGDALFDFGQSKLRPEAQSSLEKIGVVLAQFPTASVLIEGHTDSKGTPATNRGISEDRAVAVREFLKARTDLAGINFTTRGLGETKPIAPNDSEEGRQLNRRVEIVVEKAKE